MSDQQTPNLALQLVNPDTGTREGVERINENFTTLDTEMAALTDAVSTSLTNAAAEMDAAINTVTGALQSQLVIGPIVLT